LNKSNNPELCKLKYFSASTILSYFSYGLFEPETMNGQCASQMGYWDFSHHYF